MREALGSRSCMLPLPTGERALMPRHFSRAHGVGGTDIRRRFSSSAIRCKPVILSEAKDLEIGCRARMEILRFAQDDGSWSYTTPHCGRSPTGMLCHHTSSKVSGRQPGTPGEGEGSVGSLGCVRITRALAPALSRNTGRGGSRAPGPTFSEQRSEGSRYRVPF
jgi:hypothetical protein